MTNLHGAVQTIRAAEAVLQWHGHAEAARGLEVLVIGTAPPARRLMGSNSSEVPEIVLRSVVRLCLVVLTLAAVSGCAGSPPSSPPSTPPGNSPQPSASGGACTASVTPAQGAAGAEYVITAGPYPESTVAEPTIVLVEVRGPGGEIEQGGLLHATLAPGETSLIVAFHDPQVAPEPSRPPLAAGRYTVKVEDEGHTCVTETSFVVQP